MNLKPSFKRLSPKDDKDLGFGLKIIDNRERLVNKDGTFNVERRGQRGFNPYLTLVEMSWAKFLLSVVVSVVIINLVLAAVFVFNGVEEIGGMQPGGVHDFAYAFFFSVQTFTTVGYGAMHPAGINANFIAGFTALTGLLSTAVVTGLVFAKFSKPRAQILFSKRAVIAPFKDGQALMLRLANCRNNNLINATAQINGSWVEDENGNKIRRYRNLNLELDKIMMLPLNWTLVHYINEDSPLWSKTEKDILAEKFEFLVLINAHDETYNQSVYINGSYTADEVVWGKKFAPMFHVSEKGKTVLELDKIDDLIDIER